MRARSIIQSPFFLTTKFWITAIVLLGGLLAWLFFNRRPSKPSEQHEPTELERTFPLLFNYIDQVIDLDTLDQCLHLDDSISTNSRRNKRSQIIRDLNNHPDFPIQINRERNPLDRRIYGYLIEHKHKSWLWSNYLPLLVRDDHSRIKNTRTNMPAIVHIRKIRILPITFSMLLDWIIT